jgi:hypothetical protein
MPVLSLENENKFDFEAGVAFIRKHRHRARVLVHCDAGEDSSVAVVLAFLVSEFRLPLGQLLRWEHRVLGYRATFLSRP